MNSRKIGNENAEKVETKLDNFNQGKIFAVKKFGKEGFIKYMSLACRCPEEAYDDGTVYRILSQLVREIMFAGDKSTCIEIYNAIIEGAPSDIFNNNNSYLPRMIEKLIWAIHQTRVRKDDEYINGFTEEGLEEFEEKYYPIIKESLGLQEEKYNNPQITPKEGYVVWCSCILENKHDKSIALSLCKWNENEWEIGDNYNLLGWKINDGLKDVPCED